MKPLLLAALGSLVLAVADPSRERVVGLTSITATPNAIVALNGSTGEGTVLQTLPPYAFYTETAYDPDNRVFFMFDSVGGSVLRAFDLKKSIWKPDVTVDDSQCQSSGCLSEFRYDSVQKRIVAIGMGFRNASSNAIVSIDPMHGIVTQIAEFTGDCAEYLESSALDSKGQVFYAWLDCTGDFSRLT